MVPRASLYFKYKHGGGVRFAKSASARPKNYKAKKRLTLRFIAPTQWQNKNTSQCNISVQVALAPA